MIYFLDTNLVVFCLRGRSPSAMRRLHATAPSAVRVPLQVHAELLVGAAKSANPERNQARVTAFLSPFTIVCPDTQIETHYVTPISEADLWIAATVGAVAGTIVTNNVREFSRVPNLLVEDWTVT